MKKALSLALILVILLSAVTILYGCSSASEFSKLQKIMNGINDVMFSETANELQNTSSNDNFSIINVSKNANEVIDEALGEEEEQSSSPDFHADEFFAYYFITFEIVNLVGEDVLSNKYYGVLELPSDENFRFVIDIRGVKNDTVYCYIEMFDYCIAYLNFKYKSKTDFGVAYRSEFKDGSEVYAEYNYKSNVATLTEYAKYDEYAVCEKDNKYLYTEIDTELFTAISEKLTEIKSDFQSVSDSFKTKPAEIKYKYFDENDKEVDLIIKI